MQFEIKNITSNDRRLKSDGKVYIVKPKEKIILNHSIEERGIWKVSQIKKKDKIKVEED